MNDNDNVTRLRVTLNVQYPSPITKWVFVIGLFVTGLLYHSTGMNDWFTPGTVETDSLSVAANEIIAAVCMVGGMLGILFPTHTNRTNTPASED